MQAPPSQRHIFLGITLFCCLLMTTGIVYFERTLGLEPCPLCMTQRVFIVLAGLIALIGFVHNAKGLASKSYAGATALSALVGAAFSGRHLYLQQLPPDLAPACGPSLAYMLDTLPLTRTLSVMLSGDGNCAEVAWRFLGLSIPAYTLLAFAIITAAAIYLLLRRP